MKRVQKFVGIVTEGETDGVFLNFIRDLYLNGQSHGFPVIAIDHRFREFLGGGGLDRICLKALSLVDYWDNTKVKPFYGMVEAYYYVWLDQATLDGGGNPRTLAAVKRRPICLLESRPVSVEGLLLNIIEKCNLHQFKSGWQNLPEKEIKGILYKGMPIGEYLSSYSNMLMLGIDRDDIILARSKVAILDSILKIFDGDF